MDKKTIESLTPSEISRFWGLVDKSKDCWIWTPLLTNVNNNDFYYREAYEAPTHISYYLTYGIDPTGEKFYHTCQNTKCVRPEHLIPRSDIQTNRHLIYDTNLVHLKGNLLCAIDTRTTGPRPGHHDLYEVAIVPLNGNLERHRGIMPFNLYLKPRRPENVDFFNMHRHKQKKISDAGLTGSDPDQAADRLETWISKLKFKPYVKLAILSFGWVRQEPFFRDWLTNTNYDSLFDSQHRDIQTAAVYLNDKYDFANEGVPLPSGTFQEMCAKLKVEREPFADTLQNALAMGECYKRLATMFFPQ